MKRYVGIFVFLFVLMMVAPTGVLAETESNDTYGTANKISVGDKMPGNISSSGDVDWYKFTTSADGYITVDFEHELFDNSYEFWYMYIYDVTGTKKVVTDSYYVVKGNANCKTAEIGVPAGTYYIKIIPRSSYDWSNRDYSICVNFTKASDWETEFNNERQTADTIKVNKTYQGAIVSTADVDWYKFTTSADGYITVDFEHELFDNSYDFWYMYIYDATGTKKVVTDSYYAVKGNANCKTAEIGVPAGTYYVKIVPRSSYDWSNKTYSICVNFTKNSNWETEFNDDQTTADVIKVNQTYQGAIVSTADVDWYKFTTTADGYITVNFEHDLLDKNYDLWYFYLYDASGANNILGNSYYAVKGNANRETAEIGVPAGTYYIKIVPRSSYDWSNITYSVSVNFKETSKWEKEKNNVWENANEIEKNQSISGTIHGTSDVDWYKFNVAADCEVAIEFSHELINASDNRWAVYLYDETGTSQILKVYSAGSERTKTSSYVALTPGRYCIKVVPYDSYSYSYVYYSIAVAERHTCIGDWVTTQEATCTTAGSKEKHCSICNKLISTSSVSAKGHSYAGWIVTREATCIAEGTKIQKCSVCGYENSKQTIAKVAHTYSDWAVTKKATCTEKGSRYAKCKVCGDKKTEVIEKLAHNYGAWNIVSAATCQKVGSEERHCSLCGGVESRSIDKLFHIYGNWVENKEASCFEKGEKERICEKCGFSEIVELEQLIHRFGTWETVLPATCQKEGNEARICSLCGTTEVRTVEQLVHKYGEWEIVSGNVIIPPIVKEKVCEYCGVTEQTKDWGYSPILVVIVFGVVVGVVNYVRGYRKNRG